jgi:hypothetical protein
MKKLFIFLLAITIAFLAFWLTQKPEPIVESPTTRETEEPIRDGTYCYYRNQIATPSAPYAVEEHIELLVNGNNITGKKTEQGGHETQKSQANSQFHWKIKAKIE